jgi:ABC-type lipoprotein release transport system permease subunit
MGRLLLIWRLVTADLRRRPAETALLMLTILATTSTLTLGLILHGETSDPYQRTRAATAGPDVISYLFPPIPGKVSPASMSTLTALGHQAGVTGSSGPYPITWVAVANSRAKTTAEVVGRDQQPATIDQPKLTAGSWIRPGGVVLERAFADALKAHPGDSIQLNGRSFTVAGIAVTAAVPPYPRVCTIGCIVNLPGSSFSSTGLIWLTRDEATGLATANEPVAYRMDLRLADPDTATTFANSIPVDDNTPAASSWQQIRDSDAKLERNQRLALLIGSWLLGVLAIASCTVLVGGRMAQQLRRVGLLKAVGGTPKIIVSVLLAEYLLISLVAAAIGLALGRLLAPLLNYPGSGLLGSAGKPQLTVNTVAIVVLVALLVAALATLVPAVRAARTSTVRALTDTARAPRRISWLINLSAKLPTALMLGVRIAARRPRRAVMSVLSVTVTVAAIVAVLIVHARVGQDAGSAVVGLRNPATARIDQLLTVITVMLIVLAAVNAVFITWATVLDTRRSSAVARALGSTPAQVGLATSTAQVVPAVLGALLGVPAGILLVLSVSSDGTTVFPPVWLLIALVPATALGITVMSAAPARLAARRHVAEALRTDLA